MPLTRLRRVLLAGLACGLAAGVGGLAMERVRLGASDRAAFARVEADVRSQFDAIVAALRSVSAALARADAIERASIAAGDAALLMDAVERAAARTEAVAAVTVFGADRTPLAWSGRPSELPPSRTDGPEALFTVPGRSGARLVHVLPVTAGDPARRIGTIASEWSLTSGGDGIAADTIRFDSFVPVSLRARPEGAGAPPGTAAFILYSPTGEPLLEASTSTDALMEARRNWRRGVVNLVLAILAATLIVGAGSLLQLGRAGRSRSRYLWPTAGAAGLLALARALLWLALAGPWAQPPLLDAPPAGLPGALLFRSAVDLLFSATALVGVVAVAADAIDRLRLIHGRQRRPRPWTVPALLPLVLAQVGAGAVAGAGVRLCQRGLEDALLTTSLDIVHFSLYPPDTQRIALALGLVALHAAIVWSAVVVFRAALLPWRVPGRDTGATAVVGAAWAGGLLAVGILVEPAVPPVAPALWAGGTAILIAMAIGRWRARYRHASQAFRLVVGALAVIVPAVGMYPTLLRVAARAARQVVETQFGPEARDQRERIQERVQRSAGQVDRLPGLADLVEAGGPVSSRAAYAIWSSTDLGSPGFLLTSSVEVYGSDGSLASRFAFNLPEDPGAPGEWTGQECGWQTYEEVSSFASDERRLLFSGRALCRPDGRRVGAIVLRAMLDYDALSFISARSLPYELLRADPPRAREGVFGRDVEFVVYGWSRRPIYTSSGSAWRLDDGTFARLTRTRDPLWVTASKDDRDYDVHLLSDRAGIYAVGLPRLAALDHLINLAEITVLAAVLYVLICAAAMLFSTVTGLGPASGRALLREIRASFYRKLFLAFVLASLVPVGALAFVLRAFIVTEARSTLEASAVRTAATAQRVIEDYSTLSQRGATGLPNADDLMVGISRAMGQDVNVFDGPALWATSKRFLYESRLLPERTPASVYRAIVLERRSSFVDEERADEVRYMVAAAPVRVGSRSAIVTVPLALRQQETERDVEALNRRILLAAVLFVLFGAAAGYSMAERIADPVNRLTRATRRIARGDLDARVLETSSDELRSLMGDFNSMAAELQRQRAELERSHRVAAWAEMARQVAHEIKNPLTPIQLSAEHLLRLHLDRGRPLTPVLEECVTVILSQVRLLRQIAAEFSAFASSPTAHRVPTPLADLIHDVVSPYRTGLADRIRITEAVSSDLPLVNLDRTLFLRALTNVIENALHAMPSGGTLAVSAERLDGRVRLTVSDTGDGMDAEALERVFEPYFSTKTGGTGLGLPIAKRNVELNGGTIALESRKGTGTTVTIELPIEAETLTSPPRPP